jgi:hypothetical protein
MLDDDLQGWADQTLKAQPESPSPTLSLLNAIEGMLSLFAQHPDAVMESFRKGPASAGWLASQKLFTQILRNGVIAGDFRRNLDVETLGLSMVAMVFGNAAYARLTQQDLDPAGLATELYRAALAGVAAPPQPLKKSE